MRLADARKKKVQVRQRIRDALHDHASWLAHNGGAGPAGVGRFVVPLLGVGIARGEGDDDYRVAVRIARHGFRTALLNELLAGLGAEHLHVRYVGKAFPAGQPSLALQARTSGASVSHYLTGTGTVGCPVTDLGTGAPMLLSNNHVIGLENGAVAGDPVVDPGRDDGGTVDADTIAAYNRCVPIDFTGKANRVDGAVADLAPGIELRRPAAAGFSYDPSLPPAVVAKSASVRKIGRSTGLTVGRVTAVEMGGLYVDYQNGPALFEDQIEVTGVGSSFAAHGDSGSLVVDDRGAAVGLLFAVSETGVAYVNPIGPVLDMLNVRLS